MDNLILSLAQKELIHYGIQAELRFEEMLPSFELRREKGKTVIAAPGR